MLAPLQLVSEQDCGEVVVDRALLAVDVVPLHELHQLLLARLLKKGVEVSAARTL